MYRHDCIILLLKMCISLAILLGLPGIQQFTWFNPKLTLHSIISHLNESHSLYAFLPSYLSSNSPVCATLFLHATVRHNPHKLVGGRQGSIRLSPIQPGNKCSLCRVTWVAMVQTWKNLYSFWSSEPEKRNWECWRDWLARERTRQESPRFLSAYISTNHTCPE